MAVTITKKNVLLAAALLGFLTSLLIYRFLRGVQVNHQAEMLQTVVTTHEIEPRTVIEPWMVKTASVPRAQVPEGVSLRLNNVVGKVALGKIPANMPVGVKDVGDRGASLGLSYVIPDSMRAVTVGVDPVIGVAGFLKPGDRVDVVATFDNGQSAIARTVLQNVQLLALGPQVQQEQVKKDAGKAEVDQKDTATLVVTPDQAERLVLAENQGKLRLVLRGVDDYAEVPTKGVTCASMSGIYDRSGPAKVSVTQGSSSQPARSSVYPAAAPNSLLAMMQQLKALRTPPGQARPALPAVTVRPIKPALPTAAPAPPVHEIEIIRGTDVKKIQVDSSGLPAGKPPIIIERPIVKAEVDIKEVRDDEPNVR